MQNHCRKCTTTLPLQARYCPACGWDQLKLPSKGITLSTRTLGILCVSALAIGATTHYTASALAGVKPTTRYEESAMSAAHRGPSSQEIEALRKEAEAHPESSEGWKMLAGALIKVIQEKPTTSQAQVLDLIDTLGRILKIDPRDRDALLVMGDISFEQKVYDKAAHYYALFLKEVPENTTARSRYASTLTFIGKYKESEQELKKVLAKEPENFSALAYLTVTYAQKGDLKNAISTGEKAITHAPAGEAKEQVALFVARLKKGDFKPESLTPPSPTSSTNTAPTPASTSLAQTLETFFTSNPIAGPKFVRLEDTTPPSSDKSAPRQITAYFKNFPMQAMPPFARQKFLGGVDKVIDEAKFPYPVEIIFMESTDNSLLMRHSHGK